MLRIASAVSPLRSPLQRLQQSLFVTVPQLNVVGSTSETVQPAGSTHHPRHRLRFRLQHRFAGRPLISTLMQQLVSQFVGQSRQLLSHGQSRTDVNQSAERCPVGVLQHHFRVFQPNPVTGHQFFQTRQPVTGIACQTGEGRQFATFRL